MANKAYVEMMLDVQANYAGIGIGIANASYQLDEPFDVATGGAVVYGTAAFGIVTTFGDIELGGYTAGYPLTTFPGGLAGLGGWNNAGMTVAIAIDFDTGQLWFAVEPSLTGGIVQWQGGSPSSGGPTPDPVASVNGCSFLDVPSNTDYPADSPIAAPWRVAVGAYSLNLSDFPGDANVAAGTVNFGTGPAVVGIPAGYSWAQDFGVTKLLSAFKSAQITLSGGDLTFTGTGDPPANVQPVYMVLSEPFNFPAPVPVPSFPGVPGQSPGPNPGSGAGSLAIARRGVLNWKRSLTWGQGTPWAGLNSGRGNGYTYISAYPFRALPAGIRTTNV